MKKEVAIRAFDIKVILIGCVALFPPIILSVLVVAAKINSPTNQTYFIIFSLSFILIIGAVILKRKMKIVTFIFDDNSLRITENKVANDAIIVDTEMPYSEIKRYYISNSLAIKKFGYILSISNDKNYSYCINYDKNKQQRADKTNMNELINIFNKLSIKKECGFLDYFILFFFYLIWSICFLGIIVFLGVLYYIFFILK